MVGDRAALSKQKRTVPPQDRAPALHQCLTCDEVVVEPQDFKGLEVADAIRQLIQTVRSEMERRERPANDVGERRQSQGPTQSVNKRFITWNPESRLNNAGFHLKKAAFA